ncbi:hypothetical protein ACFXKC_41005 [Streptomyces sp. NPDC059340]|uniref:hypothetical protein n=1 Tax=Streptomyces sp. NPDC059340 TaxID=3346806 RepID=UPI0036A0B757
MHEDPSPSGVPLTDLQKAKVDYARRDLETFRAEDLAQLEPASLIIIIERLRTRLYEILELVDEVFDTIPPK